MRHKLFLPHCFYIFSLVVSRSSFILFLASRTTMQHTGICIIPINNLKLTSLILPTNVWFLMAQHRITPYDYYYTGKV